MPLVSGPARTRRFFDRLAPAYDRINARIYKPEWRDRVQGALKGRVLDVGVGTGYTTGHLPDAVGLDLSSQMLRRASYAGGLVRADFLRSPFRPGSFDTIVFAGSFYYLEDPIAGLRAAADLLRRGGRVVILSPASVLFAAAVHVYDEPAYWDLADRAGLHLDGYHRLNWAACLVILSKG